MSSRVVLMVRSPAKGARWRKHGEYAGRREAWEVVTSLPDKRAHVRLVEVDEPPPAIPPSRPPAPTGGE